MRFNLFLTFLVLFSLACPVIADVGGNALSGAISDPFVEAQEKLMFVKGSYKTIRQQEQAVRNMRRATKLSLKASKLRARAEQLQIKADSLITKANQHAVSRGLYITNPLAPVMMQPPPAVEQTTKGPSVVPVPGQPINIIVPKQEEVSYKENSENNSLPESPILNNF